MRRGFTLVELSIVLVIIGLLIGGILVAQSMISTAKAERLISDLQQYEIQANNFKTTYKVYPGDDTSFNPPGNADDQLSFAMGGQICHGIYVNDEPREAFAQISEAGFSKVKYLPYSALACGGTQSNNYDRDMAGIVAPYTELDQKASVAVNGAKATFYAMKEADGNFYFYFIPPPKTL